MIVVARIKTKGSAPKLAAAAQTAAGNREEPPARPPMFNNIHANAPLNFVGKIESFDADWTAMAAACGVAQLPFNDKLTEHPTSSDPQGVKDAMRNVVNNCTVRTALCLLYRQDYDAFGYTCPSCNSSDAAASQVGGVTQKLR